MIHLEDIREAAAAIEGRIHRTPLLPTRSVSERAGCTVLVKAECFQRTGSFKVRGVFNMIRSLTRDERARGLIGISAGNHAQALAYAAGAEHVKCTVVMPAKASPVKVAASKGYGAEVVLHGDVFEAWQKMEDLRAELGYTFVHPYDDERVIAGQGTAGLEILDDAPNVDVIVVPIGGGGLISGIATAVKAISPKARVYGVEPRGAAAMKQALDAGEPVRLSSIHTIADGLAAPIAGVNSLQYVKKFVDDVVLVDDDAIRDALRYILERMKLLLEPAAVAGFAALFSGAIPDVAGKTVAVVASGGNMDLARLKDLV
ncbi:MAG TPA: threonine/serine dehydratase [Longimicrobiales bacterium]